MSEGMNVIQAQVHPQSDNLRCARCGALFFSSLCVHNIAVDNMSDAEALRVQARYALGKRTNPNHDTTSYRDAAYDQQDHD